MMRLQFVTAPPLTAEEGCETS